MLPRKICMPSCTLNSKQIKPLHVCNYCFQQFNKPLTQFVHLVVEPWNDHQCGNNRQKRGKRCYSNNNVCVVHCSWIDFICTIGIRVIFLAYGRIILWFHHKSQASKRIFFFGNLRFGSVRNFCVFYAFWRKRLQSLWISIEFWLK